MTWSRYDNRSLSASWGEASLADTRSADAEHPFDEWRPGAPVRSALASGFAGAAGGAAFLFVAELVAQRSHASLDVIALAASAAHRVGVSGAPEAVAFGFAALVGALVGAFSGVLTRRLTRFGGRLLFFAIFTQVIWVFAQAFVVRRLAPWTAEGLPFLPFVAGVGAFAVCLAVMPPIRGRRRLPAPELGISRV
jgi:hypothetical protein